MNSKFTLARKLSLAIGAPVLALLIVVVVAHRGLQAQAQEIADLGLEDMPMAVLAANIDGNLMDSVLEMEKALRASYALRADEPDAKRGFEAATRAFEDLVKQSDKDYKRLGDLLAKAQDDDDPAVVSTYRALETQVKSIDAQQTAFEEQARALLVLVSQGKHAEAIAGVDKVEAQLVKVEKAITEFVGAIDKLTRDNVTNAQALAQKQANALLGVTALGLLLACALGTWVARSVLRQIGGEPEDAVEAARAIAAGQLDHALELRANDTTSLFAAMKAMNESLSRVVAEVRSNSESVATASAQIAQGNADLSQRTEEQASALQQTAATMEQLGTNVKQNADNAQQANQLAQGASTVAVKGGEVVGRVVDTMKGISDSSKKIAEIISVIDGIAFQTNILALNAAVEAARAGEQGRGFAVVASEVRSLAGRSADAAKEIKSLITASVERVDQGSALVDQAGKTMEEVVASIRRVTDIMGEISAASVEQNSGVQQIGQAISQMDQVTQHNAALVEESAAAAESLKGQAGALVQAVGVFKLAQDGTAAPAYSGTERRGPDRAKNITRPAFGKKAAAPSAAAKPANAADPVAPAESAAKKTGTDDAWASF